MEDAASTELVGTVSWGYVRLRREEYTDQQLEEWIKRLRAQKWDEAYVFFRHEDTGTGPKFACALLELAER